MLKKLIDKLKTNKSDKIIVEFSFLQFFFWSTWAIYGAYLVYYLGDLGYSNLRIGSLMSLRTFTGLIGPPIIGYLCDRLENRKYIFIISMFLMGLLITPFPFYPDWMLTIAIGAVGFLWEPQQSVLDSWILETSAKTAANYGFTRAWGSIGFASFVIIFGQIIDIFGWKLHFLGYGLIIIILSILAFNIKDNSYSKLHKKQKTKVKIEKNIMKLFKNPEYVFILAITVLLFVPTQMFNVYLAEMIKAVGGDSTDLGYTLFFNALSEAPIFFAANYFLKKYKTRSLLLMSSIFYLIRFSIAASAQSPVYFIFYGMFQSLSYGIFLITVRYYVKLVAPEALKTTAQSIVLMAAFGAGGIIGSLLGGFLIDSYSMGAMFSVSISMTAVVVLILVFAVMKDDKGLENRT